MRKLRHLRIYLALGGCIIGFILFESLSPTPLEAFLSDPADKAWHLAAFGLMMAWFGQLVLDRRLKADLALAFIGLGAGLTVAQRFLAAGRALEWRSFLAEVLGVWLAHWATRGGGGALLAAVERRLLTRS